MTFRSPQKALMYQISAHAHTHIHTHTCFYWTHKKTKSLAHSEKNDTIICIKKRPMNLRWSLHMFRLAVFKESSQTLVACSFRLSNCSYPQICTLNYYRHHYVHSLKNWMLDLNHKPVLCLAAFKTAVKLDLTAHRLCLCDRESN